MTLGTIVVNGVTTFIGCHLAVAFAHEGYRVVGALKTPLEMMDALHVERWRYVQPVLSEWVSLDLTDSRAVEALIVAQRPRLWANLAGIGRDFASTTYNFAEATQIDLLPLDVIYKSLGAVGGSVLAAGSSMEYGSLSSHHSEDFACWPDTPYGVAKLSSTLRGRQLAFQYGVPTRVARLYTLFGEFDSSTRLVARLVQRLGAGQRVGVAPGIYRDLCDISDIVKGYLAMAEDCSRDVPFDIFNLSRGSATELKEIALLVAEQVNADPDLIFEDAAALRAAEPAIICGDGSKAKTLLQWEPSPIVEGLSHMIHRSGHPAKRNDIQLNNPDSSVSPGLLAVSKR